MRRARPVGQAAKEVGQTYPALLAAQQWSAFCQHIESELDALPNVYRIRYEDLMDYPEKYILEIFRFLGLDLPTVAVDGSTVRVNGKGFDLINQNVKSLSRLCESDKAIMSPTMDRDLTKYGYTVLHEK